jgi:hypothetical protein
MLTYEPEERISCQDALNHPWIKQKVHMELSPLHLNEAINNLKAFAAKTHLQEAAITYIVS